MIPDATRQIRARFDAAAGTYDQAARVQPLVAQRVASLIPPHLTPRRILDVGTGTGGLLRLLLERFPDSAFTALDVAPAMLDAARARFDGAHRVEWVVAMAETYTPSAAPDLIASSSALHWLRPFDSAMRRLASLLPADGYLVAGLMTAGTLPELAEARRHAAPDRAASPLPDASSIAPLLASTTLHAHHVETQRHTAVYPSCRELLLRLHDIGVTSGPVARSGPPLTRGQLRRLTSFYDRNFKVAGGVRATYEVTYLVAQNGNAR